MEVLKIGDKYRWLLDTGNILTNGKCYEVIGVDSGLGCVINDRGLISTFNPKDGEFEKVEEQEKPSFDDLIDIVAQAFKDKKIFSYGVTIVGVSIRFFDESEAVFTLKDIKSGIELIQSLYKETFVIETEEDIAKINGDACITFANGNTSAVVSGIKIDGKNTIQITHLNKPLGLFFLKGATVEQDRNV